MQHISRMEKGVLEPAELHRARRRWGHVAASRKEVNDMQAELSEATAKATR